MQQDGNTCDATCLSLATYLPAAKWEKCLGAAQAMDPFIYRRGLPPSNPHSGIWTAQQPQTRS